jgi:hypothetical protein
VPVRAGGGCWGRRGPLPCEEAAGAPALPCGLAAGGHRFCGGQRGRLRAIARPLTRLVPPSPTASHLAAPARRSIPCPRQHA